MTATIKEIKMSESVPFATQTYAGHRNVTIFKSIMDNELGDDLEFFWPATPCCNSRAEWMDVGGHEEPTCKKCYSKVDEAFLVAWETPATRESLSLI